MPKRKKEEKPRKFCLVRWLDDETVSVLPVQAAKEGQKVFQGSYADFKWLGKQLYEAEVLKISGKGVTGVRFYDVILCAFMYCLQRIGSSY